MVTDWIWSSSSVNKSYLLKERKISLEVEFVKASGETLAVITIFGNNVRPVDVSDVLTVRSLSHDA